MSHGLGPVSVSPLSSCAFRWYNHSRGGSASGWSSNASRWPRCDLPSRLTVSVLFLRRARPRCGRVCHPTDPLPRQRAPRPNVAQTERAVVLTRAGLCRERYAPLLAIGRKNASSATILSRTAGANSEPLLALAGIGNSPKCPPSTARAALSMSRPRSFRLRPKKSICFHFRLLRAARRASSCSRRSRRPRSCIRFIRVNHFALFASQRADWFEHTPILPLSLTVADRGRATPGQAAGT